MQPILQPNLKDFKIKVNTNSKKSTSSIAKNGCISNLQKDSY